MPSAALAAGTSYYIDNRPDSGCSDTGPGTQAQPWCNLTRANAEAPYAPGDSILLARGATWNQQLDLSGSGTEDSWITLGAYGTGDKPKILRSQGDNELSVKLTDPDYWAVEHLEVGNAATGLLVRYATKFHEGLRIHDITTHDNKGIWAGHSKNYPFGGPVADPWAAENDIILSAGVLVTVDPDLAFTDVDDYAARDIEVTDLSGTHNINTLAFSATNEGPDHKQNGTFPLQDITASHVYVDTDDGHAATEYQSATLGCSDSIRFVGVTRAVMKDSSLLKGAGCHTITGTAQVFIGMVNDLTFVNSTFVGTPYTGSNDQTAIDFEFFQRNVKIRNSFFAGNAGPGVEMLGIHHPHPDFPNSPLDEVSNVEFDGNTFSHNNWARTGGTNEHASIHHGGTSSAPTGVVSNNVYTEPNKLWLGGDRIEGLATANNRSVKSAGNYAAARFSGTQGAEQWRYRYLDGANWSDLPTFSTAFLGGAWTAGAGQRIGPFEMTPVAGSDVARVWTAPYDGVVSVRGRILKADTGDGSSSGNGVAASIVKVGSAQPATLWPSSASTETIAGDDGVGITTDVDAVSVSAGDQLYFIVSSNGSDDAHDSASWTPSVAYLSSTTPYDWTFSTPSDLEGWNENSWNQVSSAEVSEGALTITSSGTDPYILSQANLELSSDHRYIKLRVKNGSSDGNGAIYFSTTDAPGFSGTRVVTFQSPPQAAGYSEVIVDMASNPEWTGTISQLRIDPFGTPGTMSIDSISIGTV